MYFHEHIAQDLYRNAISMGSHTHLPPHIILSTESLLQLSIAVMVFYQSCSFLKIIPRYFGSVHTRLLLFQMLLRKIGCLLSLMLDNAKSSCQSNQATVGKEFLVYGDLHCTRISPMELLAAFQLYIYMDCNFNMQCPSVCNILLPIW